MIGFKGKRTSALKDVFISIKKRNKQITGGGESIRMCAGDGRMTTRTSVEKSGGALLFRGLGGGWRPPTVCQTSRTMNTLVARWEGKRCKGMGERGGEGRGIKRAGSAQNRWFTKEKKRRVVEGGGSTRRVAWPTQLLCRAISKHRPRTNASNAFNLRVTRWDKPCHLIVEIRFSLPALDYPNRHNALTTINRQTDHPLVASFPSSSFIRN